MSTLLQTGDGDLAIVGSPPGLNVVRDADVEVAQKLAGRFRLWRGEWRYDVRAGVPYLASILGQTEADFGIVRSIVERIVIETPGVVAVDSIDLVYEGVLRTATISIRVRSQTGALLVGQVGGAFLVEEG